MGRLTRVGPRFGRESRREHRSSFDQERGESPSRAGATAAGIARELLLRARAYRGLLTCAAIFIAAVALLTYVGSSASSSTARSSGLQVSSQSSSARRTAAVASSGSSATGFQSGSAITPTIEQSSAANYSFGAAAGRAATANGGASAGSPGLAAVVTEEIRVLDDTLHAMLGARSSPTRADLERMLASVPAKPHTLRFPVCNGFANQRLSVVYGVLLAHRLGRTPVLPMLLRDGLQRTDAAVVANGVNRAAFDEVYDSRHFMYEMAKRGIRVLEPHEAPLSSSYTEVPLASVGPAIVQGLNVSYGHLHHLAVDCPLFKIAPQELDAKRDEGVIWAALDALRPADKAHSLVSAMVQSIKSMGAAAAAPTAAQGGIGHVAARGGAGSSTGGSAGGSTGSSSSSSGGGNGGARKPAPRFNYLHLRLENDWVEHCKRWSSIPDGVVRDNCYNNTEEVDVQLRLFGFTTDTPLYVASYWDDVDPERAKKVMERLKAAGYRVVTSADVFPEALRAEGREMRALVEYFVGMEANRFIGNSVSTFAALSVIERRHRGLWAAYYNGGNLPIAPYLPVLKMPWVFTYNSWSEKYDYMLKAAVRSAAAVGTLKPYCIFDGDAASPIGHWLVDNNVTLIRHLPSWREQLVAKAQGRMKDNVQHSHLFKNPDMLVSTFQRVDLPVVPILDQYTYVLYTDADVYFRRPIHLDDFGLPLPRSVSMSYEFYKMFPYNAGIILANLPTMRRNYKAFIAMMLDNDDGLYYPNFGPADQGIINKFYEADLRSQMLNQAFNTKPYNDFDPASFLVHFHGPKPHEYLAFLDSGQCEFFNVCEQGVLRALCPYIREWAVHLPEEVVATRLQDACMWLSNPTIMSVFQRKTGLVSAAQVVPDDKKTEFTQRQ